MGLLLLSRSPTRPDPLYDMNSEQAQQMILERWDAVWGATTPWRLEPLAFNPPLAIGAVAWASLNFLPISQARQHTLGAVGARRFERLAILFVELRIPVAQAQTAMTRLISKVADAFEGWSLGGLHGREVSAQDPVNDSNEYAVVVECTFTYYERK